MRGENEARNVFGCLVARAIGPCRERADVKRDQVGCSVEIRPGGVNRARPSTATGVSSSRFRPGLRRRLIPR